MSALPCVVTADLDRYLDRLEAEDRWTAHAEQEHERGYREAVEGLSVDRDPSEPYAEGYAHGARWRRTLRRAGARPLRYVLARFAEADRRERERRAEETRRRNDRRWGVSLRACPWVYDEDGRRRLDVDLPDLRGYSSEVEAVAVASALNRAFGMTHETDYVASAVRFVLPAPQAPAFVAPAVERDDDDDLPF